MAGKLVLCRHGQSDWNLNMFWPWACRMKLRKRPINQVIGGLCTHCLMAPVTDRRRSSFLIAHLMELAFVGGGLIKTGRNHEHGDRI